MDETAKLIAVVFVVVGREHVAEGIERRLIAIAEVVGDDLGPCQVVIHAEDATAAPRLAIGHEPATVGELGVATCVAKAAIKPTVRPERHAVHGMIAMDAAEASEHSILLAGGPVGLDLDRDDV